MADRVGIDLGTTNSCIAYINELGVPAACPNRIGKTTTPSIIAIKDGKIIVGEEAAELGAFSLAPSAELFKREMGSTFYKWVADDRTFTPEELSAEVLKSLCDDFESEKQKRPTSAVVTVPAYFKDPQRIATRKAIELAGLEEIVLINEPTAAAIAFGARPSSVEGKILVYDLGGGTFDITIMDFGEDWRVIGSDGDNKLGGADWDMELSRYIEQEFQDETGLSLYDDPEAAAELGPIVEGVKRELSTREEVPVSFSAHSQRFTMRIERETFADLTSPLVLRTLQITNALLSECELKKDDIEDVILVGGATRMPMVQEALEHEFNRPPNRSINPDEAVALGAAIHAEAVGDRASKRGMRALPPSRSGNALATSIRYKPIIDVTNHSLGMVAVNEDRTEYINSIIVPRHRPVPCTETKPFRFLFRAPDDELEVFVTQGESHRVQSVTVLGRYAVRNLPHTVFQKPCIVEISYSYDEGSVVTVHARQSSTDEWIEVVQQDLTPEDYERFDNPPEQEVIREHLSILAYIDVSGSMDGPPISNAKQALREMLESIDLSSTSVGVGVVSDRTQLLLKPGQDAKEIMQAIDKIEERMTGWGNEADPFDEIKQQFANTQGMRAAIILADGEWYDQPGAIRRAQACHEAGITVAAIGFGDAHKTFLEAISSVSDLSHFISESRLSETFGTVAQQLTERAGIKAL